MARLRKMLGSTTEPAVIQLMALIETQSNDSLSRWAAEYTTAHYLPLLNGETDPRILEALEAVGAYLQGDMPLKEAKRCLSAARKAAQEETDPVRQAAVRAISTACGTLTAPANALGFAFYGAAAYAYSTAGTEANRGTYDRLAQEELNRILESLRKEAAPNAPHPVNVHWNC